MLGLHLILRKHHYGRYLSHNYNKHSKPVSSIRKKEMIKENFKIINDNTIMIFFISVMLQLVTSPVSETTKSS